MLWPGTLPCAGQADREGGCAEDGWRRRKKPRAPVTRRIRVEAHAVGRQYPVREDADVRRVLQCERVWRSAAGRDAHGSIPGTDYLCAFRPEARLASGGVELGAGGAEGEASPGAYRTGCRPREIPPDAVAPVDTGSLVFRQAAGDTAGDLKHGQEHAGSRRRGLEDRSTKAAGCQPVTPTRVSSATAPPRTYSQE